MKTKLALAIKRQMIKAIHAGIPGWADEPEEQKEILAKYKKYGDQVKGINFFDFCVKVKIWTCNNLP